MFNDNIRINTKGVPILGIKFTITDKKHIPIYSTKGASGADLFADISSSLVLKAGETKWISTGLSIELPEGMEAQVRPRSGLMKKFNIMGLLGTIDSDYRGIIEVGLYNIGSGDHTINRGDRIAQLIVTNSYECEFSITNSLSKTTRGKRGFGSTDSLLHKYYEEIKTKLESEKTIYGLQDFIYDINESDEEIKVTIEFADHTFGTLYFSLKEKEYENVTNKLKHILQLKKSNVNDIIKKV